jgi:hypothetical protein
LEDARSKTNFGVLAPEYVPEGLQWLPAIEARGDEAILHFWRDKQMPPNSPELLYVQIIERGGSDRTCPPCPGDDPPDVEQIDLVGTKAALTRARSSELGLSQTVLFNVANLHVRVTLDWEFPSGSTPEISAAMRKDALDVAKSIIENADR